MFFAITSLHRYRLFARPAVIFLACLAAWPLAYGKPLPLAPRLPDEKIVISAQEKDDLCRCPEAEARLQPLPHLAEEERWLDIAGHRYGNAFRCSYQYADAEVRVQYQRIAATFRGRLSAHRLKPNFAYQIKLQGDFAADPATHRRLGYLGRWRLPGRRTNYTDADYENSPDPGCVESYILFDYLVTDSAGNAEKEFSLDSSLHVIWNDAVNESLVWGDAPPRTFWVRAVGKAYAIEEETAIKVTLSAENEGPARRRFALGEVRLPTGRYACRLVLTEESFHDRSEGGGYWATVLGAPVRFIVDCRPFSRDKGE